MGRNKKQPPLKRKSKEEKSCFRVDQSRALKAKKNKDSVRFSKMKTAEEVAKLNRNLDSLRSAGRTFNKPDRQFVNPAAESGKQYEQTSHDLDDAIDKISSL